MSINDWVRKSAFIRSELYKRTLLTLNLSQNTWAKSEWHSKHHDQLIPVYTHTKSGREYNLNRPERNDFLPKTIHTWLRMQLNFTSCKNYILDPGVRQDLNPGVFLVIIIKCYLRNVSFFISENAEPRG